MRGLDRDHATGGARIRGVQLLTGLLRRLGLIRKLLLEKRQLLLLGLRSEASSVGGFGRRGLEEELAGDHHVADALTFRIDVVEQGSSEWAVAAGAVERHLAGLGGVNVTASRGKLG